MTKARVPWIVAGIFVAYVAASALPLPAGPASGFDLTAFRTLPVQANGRVQPFDSVARTALLQIRGPVTAIDGFKAPQARPALIDPDLWLLEVLAKPDTADTRRIFPIKNRELPGKLQLQPASHGTNYYAFNDLGPKASVIENQAQQSASVKASDRAPWQEEVIALRDKLVLYERLKNSMQPNTRLQQDANGKPITFDFAAELARYQVDLNEALRVDAGRRRGNAERLGVAVEMRIRAFSRLFQIVSRTGMLSMVPRPRKKGSSGDWSNLGSVVVQSALGHQPSEPVAFLAGMSSAFAQGKPEAFNSQVGQYRQWLATNGHAPQMRKGRLEAISDLLLPLGRGAVLYAVALVLALVAWRTRSATVQRSAVMLILLALALHGTGLVFATLLAGTPSWIAFLGWTVGATAGLLALVVERFRRHGTLACAAIGLMALVAAYAVTPGGAASLLRQTMEGSLLVAIAATAVVLFVSRESRPPLPAAMAPLEIPIA